MDTRKLTDQELIDYVLAGNDSDITQDTVKACLADGIFGLKPNRGVLVRMLRKAVEEHRSLNCCFVDGESCDGHPTPSRVELYLSDAPNFVFVKNNPDDVIFWVDNPGAVGLHLFSFDKKKIFNLFLDYPHNLNEQEKTIFDKENPYWVEFFADRQPHK